jgi:hypothetical protein
MILSPDDVDPEDRRLCVRCIGESYLKDFTKANGDEAVCHYCNRKDKTLSIADVAGIVEKAFDEHYVQTLDGDEGYNEGDEVEHVIADAVQVNEDVACDIRNVLDEKTSSPPDEQFDIDPFDKSAHYTLADHDDILYQEEWRLFEKSLKTEARFFSQTGYATLKNVFTELDTHRTDMGCSVIVAAGLKKEISSLYRARVFQSESKLKEALMHPDHHIGPPASTLATPGRMNARGISIFYGAKEPKTALAELRPPVGSDVAIGRFDFIKDVRLLDMNALAAVEVTGSIFDSSYKPRLERAKFLSSLSRRITRPILPDDELSEYLVTQAIADFLATELKLDGVIYRSAQAKGGTNVALFHHAAQVAPHVLSEGTTVTAYTSDSDEDGTHRSFIVYEEVPAPSPPKPKQYPISMEWNVQEGTTPEPVLNLDLQSIVVCEIKAVEYSWDQHQVARVVSEKRDHLPF